METPFNSQAVVVDRTALKPVGIPSADTSVKQSNAVKDSTTPVPATPTPTVQPVNQSGYTPSGLFINSDGTINYAKSLENAKQKALEIQKKATELARQQNTGTSSFVSSSAPVVQQEQNTTSDVSKLMASLGAPDNSTDSASSASKQYMDLLDAQAAALEARRKTETDVINKQFDSAKIGLTDTQKRETGTTSGMLARAGGYLGPSGSATGVLLTLAQNHKAEVVTLEAKRASAIQEANNAIDDKQFVLAQMKVKEVKDIEQTINDRKQQFFDNSLKAIQESRNQDEFYRTKIQDDLKTLGTLATSDQELELDPKIAAEIDSYYGVSGFTQQYLNVINKQAKAKTAADQVTNQKNMLELLEKIPAGQKVSFPDGTEYTGLGSAGDIYSTLEVDSNGIGRMVTYDKRSGKINVTNVGAVGKPSSSITDVKNAVVEDNVTAQLQIQLEAEKLPDGSYDPDTYIRERKMIKEADPALVSKMDAKFLNPSNGFFTTDAINQLRKKGIYAATPSL